MKKTLHGLLALSPLAVFLAVYLAASLAAGDFYAVPVTSAFLVTAIYAILITPGKMKDRVLVFSAGAGERKVLLMVWIFILAGAFAAVAKAIGSVDATVNLTIALLPPKFLLAGLFLAACFISMSIGTSVGTIVALAPVAVGIAENAGLDLPMVMGLIVGGALFGDNLSFISDTTIAATSTQGCRMSDKFKTNLRIAVPAAVVAFGIYLFIGLSNPAETEAGNIDVLKLLPYLTVIVLAICGVDVLVVLTIGLGLCVVIGLLDGASLVSLLGNMGEGIKGMDDLICVTFLAAGVLETVKHNGGIDYMVGAISKHIRGRRGAEGSIAAIVSLADLCTANNTIAILTTGNIARNISERYGVDPRRSASILDTFSCFIQGLIPYGAQLLMASALAGIPAVSIIRWEFYPFALFLTATLSIVFRFQKK